MPASSAELAGAVLGGWPAGEAVQGEDGRLAGGGGRQRVVQADRGQPQRVDGAGRTAGCRPARPAGLVGQGDGQGMVPAVGGQRARIELVDVAVGVLHRDAHRDRGQPQRRRAEPRGELHLGRVPGERHARRRPGAPDLREQAGFGQLRLVGAEQRHGRGLAGADREGHAVGDLLREGGDRHGLPYARQPDQGAGLGGRERLAGLHAHVGPGAERGLVMIGPRPALPLRERQRPGGHRQHDEQRRAGPRRSGTAGWRCTGRPGRRRRCR